MLCFFITFSADAQEIKFTVKLKLQIKDGNLDNAVINMTKNGTKDRVIDPSKGKYFVDLDLNAEYVLTFTKMGYITKSIIIDTHVPSDRAQYDFAKFEAIVELNKQPEEEIITYTQPVGKINYSAPFGDFDFDKDYTASAQGMQKRAEANPTPKPKPPAPNPKPETSIPKPPEIQPAKPTPVAGTPPEYKPEPVKPKSPVVAPETPWKPSVRNKAEKILQGDRKIITVVTVNIDGVDCIYRKEEYNWGGRYFYKDGGYITENSFDKETE